MTSTRAPSDVHADTELHRRIHAESPYWDMMYQAMLGQLTDYIDLAVARALASHGVALGGGPVRATERERPVPSQARGAGLPDGGHRAQPDLSGHPGPLAAGIAIPPWLQPFTLPEKVRFTRTPDALLRTERMVPQGELQDAPEEVESDPVPEVVPFNDDVPTWRKPFTLPPNVRFNRTPQRRAAEPDRADRQDGAEPPGDRARAAGSEAALETPGFEQGPVEPVEPGSLSDEAEAPVPAWFGIIRPESVEGLRVANEQDNGRLGLEAIEPSDEALADAMIAAAWLTAHADHASATSGDNLDDHDLETEARAVLAPGRLRIEPRADGRDRNASPESEGPEGSGPALKAGAGLAEKPVGIASPEDARAFVGPSRAGSAKRSGPAPHGLAPLESVNRVKTDPALWEDPPLELLVEPPQAQAAEELSSGALEQNARLLEGVLEEFGVRGEIIDVRPGPVVTLYELEPAPGTKSSRVIGLSDDIARSMSAVSARVAVVQGRNVIGIELPNQRRETVFLRALLSSDDFGGSKHRLAIALGKTIGGEPITVDLARMPHLLVAGTTGSGKSVAINTMILSLLYRLRPEECRLIMIDPKMLELSVYEGIPHLLTPVVTDPKKAVVALKWAVREMEDRYKKMSKVGVRNIDGFNARVAEAAANGEVITRTVQTGFNRETGEALCETEEMELSPLPYIVVIVDEMADLMMVAGKDIEGAIQRLAQMARAAGIHLIMATQRPSVDVITGTIKANFPTRISFQVTSKIDSRTILGEQGAEQLLGQGDMLYMAGGGRISRVHGPFVSDGEVEKVVAHLKLQGHPDYLDVVVAEEETAEAKPDAADEKPVFERGAMGDEDSELYEQAVKVVLRDKKCSTSYIQRRLQVGYNKAASLVERMEKEGLVGQANNAGKREILVYSRDLRFTESRDGED